RAEGLVRARRPAAQDRARDGVIAAPRREARRPRRARQPALPDQLARDAIKAIPVTLERVRARDLPVGELEPGIEGERGLDARDAVLEVPGLEQDPAEPLVGLGRVRRPRDRAPQV